MMHKGMFPRAAIWARKRTLVHRRKETLYAEKIGPRLLRSLEISCVQCVNYELLATTP